MKSVLSFSLFFSSLLIIGCTSPAIKAPAGSLISPGQLPNAAKDNHGNINLVFGSGDSILYTISKDKGQSFSITSLVAVLPGLVDFAMRGPQIAATANGATIIACNKAGNIFSYSMDAAGKWLPPLKVNDADSIAKEGFLALGADGDNAFAVWLDLRGNKRNKIMGAKSPDGGKTWSENILVYASPDSTVCECCKPSVAVQGTSVYVMFRNWLNGNRDMHLIQSADGGSTFGAAIKLGNGNWALNGCPMDGGGLALSNGIPQTVWRREGKLYTCSPEKSETLIGEGKNCAIETVDGKSVYAWVEKDDVVLLKPGNIKVIVGKGSLPLIKAVDNNHVLCVWQHDKEVHGSVVAL